MIASQAAVPLIYVPLEAVASKWYGESERNLAEIFRAAEQLGGAIIFLDEIDSLATHRRSNALQEQGCKRVDGKATALLSYGLSPHCCSPWRAVFLERQSGGDMS